MPANQQERSREIMKMVCDAVAYAIERDLEGDEQIMKEVWEQLESEEEDEVAKDQMRRIIGHLRQPLPSPRQLRDAANTPWSEK
jgi:hypothetical protein